MAVARYSLVAFMTQVMSGGSSGLQPGTRTDPDPAQCHTHSWIHTQVPAQQTLTMGWAQIQALTPRWVGSRAQPRARQPPSQDTEVGSRIQDPSPGPGPAHNITPRWAAGPTPSHRGGGQDAEHLLQRAAHLGHHEVRDGRRLVVLVVVCGGRVDEAQGGLDRVHLHAGLDPAAQKLGARHAEATPGGGGEGGGGVGGIQRPCMECGVGKGLESGGGRVVG